MKKTGYATFTYRWFSQAEPSVTQELRDKINAAFDEGGYGAGMKYWHDNRPSDEVLDAVWASLTDVRAEIEMAAQEVGFSPKSQKAFDRIMKEGPHRVPLKSNRLKKMADRLSPVASHIANSLCDYEAQVFCGALRGHDEG
jgi:hypothetical protein